MVSLYIVIFRLSRKRRCRITLKIALANAMPSALSPLSFVFAQLQCGVCCSNYLRWLHLCVRAI